MTAPTISATPKKPLISGRHPDMTMPTLHLVEHALVLPAPQALHLVGRASRLERAGQACCEVAIVIDIIAAV